ncbi:helix-turn-helix transcriptional regulator [Virgibacillus byunsanensis]|uniref:Helix-turn-helix transcriptional regulator n=1 Tax=Virgibacillus byunsanensis TaxID=570945 RepID=A0ABW3LQ61_9BACI
MHSLKNKRKSTKQKLLDILKKDHEDTIHEIMNHFQISEIAVRRHLHELEQQGFVKTNTIKQKVGRPYFTYALTKKGHGTFPNQYEQLPLEILQDLKDLQGEEAVKNLLKRRMEREKSYFQSEIQGDEFDQRVKELAGIQDEKGYMVELEKVSEGYEIKHYNCPIANIASMYHQLCKNEHIIFEDVFPNSEIISHSCITKGDNFCKWTIKKPQEK